MTHNKISIVSSPKPSSSNFYIVVALITALAGLLFGYDTGVISGAILFIKDQFHLSVEMNGVIVSAMLLGALFGAILSGYFVDHFGRKYSLIMDAIVFIIGTLIASMATTVPLLIIGRIIVGLAVGISSYVAPLYIAEISPSSHRGVLVSLNQLTITMGIMLAYVVDYIFAWHKAWRYMFACGVIPALLLLVGMIFLPLSPRWALSRGYLDKTHAILQRIYGGDRDTADQAFLSIEKSLKVHKGSWRLLFTGEVRPALIIAVGLAFFQQVTGINTILYYAPTIFNMTGLNQATVAILATMGIGIVLVISTILALFLIDRWGRRPLLLLGVIAMLLSLMVLSLAFYLSTANSPWLSWLAFASMLVYIAGFSIGLGPVMWLMISEVFPLRIRGLGSSLSTFVNWASNWLIAITFLSLVQFLTAGGTFLLYALISIVTLWFVYVLVPETKGVSLEKIEKNLYAGKPSRDLGC